MHEMSLVRRVVDIVLEECEGKDIEEVVSVQISLGELSDVVVPYVESLFQHLAKDTIAAHATIKINRVPAYVRCRDCSDIHHIDFHDESTWYCPRCGVYKNYRLISGHEFRIDEIQVKSSGGKEKCA